ncbi:MAG: hypothetical protein OJF52_001944 [Nitrospira sp.]|jgi:prepilin-type N-terminal cleavage/methylation domain-containing protein|nr:MAG: hypothetical protein OJF52_001944 [Nitrospira sp.]
MGFTLLEVIVTLCIMGMVLSLAFPLIGLHDPLKDASRRIVGAIHLLHDAAVSSKQTYRLYFDIDRQNYWAVIATRDGEHRPYDDALADGLSLTNSVRIGRITTSRQGKVAAGRAFVELHPDGRVDPAVILLSDLDNHVLSLTLGRFSGHVRITDQVLDLIPPPIPPTLLSFFRSLRPVSPKPRT